jgi:hypothetical protein
MTKVKITLSITVALGLLAGTAVGVSAQDEIADPMAPGVVTGSIAQWRAVPPGTQQPEAGFVGIEDVTHAHVWEATDPRLAGEVTYTGHWHRYPAPAYMQVEAAIFELVNDAGRWLGQATALDLERGGWDTVVFIGDGAYEGLTA